MGRNRDLRRKIASLRRRIGEHEGKIQQQSAERSPDDGLIAHWRHEIDTWEKELARLARRLERNWVIYGNAEDTAGNTQDC